MAISTAVNQAFRYIFQHRLVAEQVELLENHGGFPAEPLDILLGNMGEIHRHVADGELPGLRLFQVIQAAEKSGLPGARGPQNGHDASFFHGQIDIF